MYFSQVVKSPFLVVLLGGTLTQVRCFSFNYPVFSDSDHLIKSRDSNIELGAIQVTLDVGGAPITNLFGRLSQHCIQIMGQDQRCDSKFQCHLCT